MSIAERLKALCLRLQACLRFCSHRASHYEHHIHAAYFGLIAVQAGKAYAYPAGILCGLIVLHLIAGQGDED